MCFKSRGENVALNASKSLASKPNAFWFQITISGFEVPESHLLIKGQPKESVTSYAPKLFDVLEKYCRLKGAEEATSSTQLLIGWICD